MMKNKLLRSKKSRVINGTCAGLANYLNLPIPLVRFSTFLSCIFFFPIILPIYLLCYFFIESEETVDDNYEYHGLNLTNEFTQLDKTLSEIENKLSTLEDFVIKKK